MSDEFKDKKPQSQFQGAVVRQLANILKETDLTEIEYEVGGSRIRVARHITQNHMVNMGPSVSPSISSSSREEGQAHPLSSPALAPASEENHIDLSKHPGTLKSPMVGTAYLSPSPDDPTYVQVGSHVKEGDTLMIIEAMKVMNPIRSPKSGKITHILVQNAEPVEYAQPLVIIE